MQADNVSIIRDFQVIFKGKDISVCPFTPKERKILSVFINAEDNIVDRNTLQKAAWQNSSVTSKILDVYLCAIRKKLALTGTKIKLYDYGTWKLV